MARDLRIAALPTERKIEIFDHYNRAGPACNRAGNDGLFSLCMPSLLHRTYDVFKWQ
jgi:hypothetical protein